MVFERLVVPVMRMRVSHPSTKAEVGWGGVFFFSPFSCGCVRQTNSACIIVSGLLGIFYYHEGGSLTLKLVWAAAAAWTLASIVLLGLEKAT